VRELVAPAGVDSAVLALWSATHGYASLVIDGALRPTRSERERTIDKLLDTMVSAIA
jgi:hypothetical protein